MATYPSVDTYVEDLNALILSHKDKLVAVTAEIDVLNTFIQKHWTICDDLASQIKKIDSDIDASSDIDSINAMKENKAALHQQLISSWSKKKWFEEELEGATEKRITVFNELNILMSNLVHVVEEHPTV